jgi:hypothetical protein
MPTVIVVEGAQAKSRAAARAIESPLFATLLDSALVAIDAN